MPDPAHMNAQSKWDLAVQIFTPSQGATWAFDILDPTKMVPEELVPLRRIGRLKLNRVPDNFYAEVEQVAFMPQNIVPGIDFTDDPLLQGRTFSYLDTQLKRLGSPNWPELPISRSLVPVSNNQREGHLRYRIDPGRVNYEPNTLHARVYLPEHLLSDAGVFVNTGVTIETALVALYLAATQRGAARAQARLALMAAQYGADDAQHLALLGHLAGLSPHGLAGPTPTVDHLSEAVAALKPFFHGGAGFTGPVSARVAQVMRTPPTDTAAARTQVFADA